MSARCELIWFLRNTNMSSCCHFCILYSLTINIVFMLENVFWSCHFVHVTFVFYLAASLIHKTVVVIPAYLNIRVVIGTGLRNGSRKAWRGYNESIYDVTSTVNFREITGNKGNHISIGSDIICVHP